MNTQTQNTAMLIAVSLTSLLFTIPVGATEVNARAIKIKTGNPTETTLPGHSLILAGAERRESPFICSLVGEEWEDEVYFETRTFHLNICNNKSNGSLLYVGENKKTGDSIKLPAIRSAKGPFVVENGRTTYIIDGKTLSIYNGNSKRPANQEQIINSKRP
ncbi:MAG TPA: hypothetical protein V6D11_24435 [Waterburya sp.]|jgi:hypothetical protein